MKKTFTLMLLCLLAAAATEAKNPFRQFEFKEGWHYGVGLGLNFSGLSDFSDKYHGHKEDYERIFGIKTGPMFGFILERYWETSNDNYTYLRTGLSNVYRGYKQTEASSKGPESMASAGGAIEVPVFYGCHFPFSDEQCSFFIETCISFDYQGGHKTEYYKEPALDWLFGFGTGVQWKSFRFRASWDFSFKTRIQMDPLYYGSGSCAYEYRNYGFSLSLSYMIK